MVPVSKMINIEVFGWILSSFGGMRHVDGTRLGGGFYVFILFSFVCF
jgi:hypothetical protein